MPFGDQSFQRDNLKYLTVQNVFMDFLELIKEVKRQDDQPTILFGGSYGGMLSAWMRMKYPNLVQGAVASSAPILHFRGAVDPSEFTRVASKVMRKQGGDECYDLVHKGFFDIVNL